MIFRTETGIYDMDGQEVGIDEVLYYSQEDGPRCGYSITIDGDLVMWGKVNTQLLQGKTIDPIDLISASPLPVATDKSYVRNVR